MTKELLEPTLPAQNEREAKQDIEAMLNSGHQSLLTAMVAQSPYGVIVSDPQGRLVLQNAAARRGRVIGALTLVRSSRHPSGAASG